MSWVGATVVCHGDEGWQERGRAEPASELKVEIWSSMLLQVQIFRSKYINHTLQISFWWKSRQSITSEVTLISKSWKLESYDDNIHNADEDDDNRDDDDSISEEWKCGFWVPSVSPSEALVSKPFKTQSVLSQQMTMMMVKMVTTTMIILTMTKVVVVVILVYTLIMITTNSTEKDIKTIAHL